MVVTGRAYDIIVAKDNTDFVLRSWLSELPSKGAHSCALPRPRPPPPSPFARLGSRLPALVGITCAAARLAQPDRLVIGLNPPYGKNNSLADEFTRHAATFKPRVIVSSAGARQCWSP